MEEIHLPKGLLSIDGHGLSSEKAVKVTIPKESKIFQVKKGSIVNDNTGKLYSAYVKDGVLDVPNNVTDMYTNAFLGSKLSKIIIPDGVKTVGSILEMSDSTYLTIDIKAKKPPKIHFYCNVNVKNVTLYVPKGCKRKYEKKWASRWREDGDLDVKIIEQ